MASGFPHIQISPSNRQLAYECCLSNEVITKRIPSLGDLRKGISSEVVFGRQTLLDLAREHEEIRNILFPKADARINLQDVKKLIEYSTAEDVSAIHAKLLFQKYLDEVSQRGQCGVLS